MVDFNKRINVKRINTPTDPIELYDLLDRASDKGPLRPAQLDVLGKWYSDRKDDEDVIVKLHTGQGKTLVGLLMLQAKLNANLGPAVYLCPNNYLVDQTCLQAEQFGIKICKSSGVLPSQFIDSKSILVTSVQKLFNGLSKFGLRGDSIEVGTILLDDAHACVDSIRNAFSIHLDSHTNSYKKILELFSDSLKTQGAGTYIDIVEGDRSAILPVPYWDWENKFEEVSEILSEEKGSQWVKFAWPLLKDELRNCQCVVSGKTLEIEPYVAPLEIFGSFSHAKHRIFMSATVTDDSFLIKGLKLSPNTVQNPLIYNSETWSGEKMVLIPELIDETLTQEVMISLYGKEVEKKYGIVALCRSTHQAGKWEEGGARLLDKNNLESEIQELRNGNFKKTLVLANKYDGIDLPDNLCRILIIDGKPYSDNLIDRLSSSCRTSSNAIALRIARSIEQGLGRAVRGEKDYCAIILSGTDLVEFARTRKSRQFLSSQTRAQIEIGLEIAEMGRDELASGEDSRKVLFNLLKQSIQRDVSWKQYYSQTMDDVEATSAIVEKTLEIFSCELDAEICFMKGDSENAISIIQNMIDEFIEDEDEKGWYLQEMARYAYRTDRAKSNSLQVFAHEANRYLLKPQEGMNFTKLEISSKRTGAIRNWMSDFIDHAELMIGVNDILGYMDFGVSSDKFENAIHKIGVSLGFSCERPDKEWKKGPDNLWAVRESEYFVIECKNEVKIDRERIYKSESGQMNNSTAWFKKNYKGGVKSTNIMVIPTKKLAPAAGFNDEVMIMQPKHLRKFKNSVRTFFKSFADKELAELTDDVIQAEIDHCNLNVDSFVSNYTENVIDA